MIRWGRCKIGGTGNMPVIQNDRQDACPPPNLCPEVGPVNQESL